MRLNTHLDNTHSNNQIKLNWNNLRYHILTKDFPQQKKKKKKKKKKEKRKKLTKDDALFICKPQNSL